MTAGTLESTKSYRFYRHAGLTQRAGARAGAPTRQTVVVQAKLLEGAHRAPCSRQCACALAGLLSHPVVLISWHDCQGLGLGWHQATDCLQALKKMSCKSECEAPGACKGVQVEFAPGKVRAGQAVVLQTQPGQMRHRGPFRRQRAWREQHTACGITVAQAVRGLHSAASNTLGLVTCEPVLAQFEGNQLAGVGAPAGWQRAAERVVHQGQLVKGQLAP